MVWWTIKLLLLFEAQGDMAAKEEDEMWLARRTDRESDEWGPLRDVLSPTQLHTTIQIVPFAISAAVKEKHVVRRLFHLQLTMA